MTVLLRDIESEVPLVILEADHIFYDAEDGAAIFQTPDLEYKIELPEADYAALLGEARNGFIDATKFGARFVPEDDEDDEVDDDDVED